MPHQPWARTFRSSWEAPRTAGSKRAIAHVCSTSRVAGERVHGRSMSQSFIVRFETAEISSFRTARQRPSGSPRSERLPPTSPFRPPSRGSTELSGRHRYVPSVWKEARLPTRVHPREEARSPALLLLFGAEREWPRAARRFLPYVNELEARPRGPRQLSPRRASSSRRDASRLATKAS